jgi:hypothetical protein
MYSLTAIYCLYPYYDYDYRCLLCVIITITVTSYL